MKEDTRLYELLRTILRVYIYEGEEEATRVVSGLPLEDATFIRDYSSWLMIMAIDTVQKREVHL